MNVVVVMVIVVFAAASALAYAPMTQRVGVLTTVVHVTGEAREPATLLLSGSILLGLAGVLRRFTL